MSTINQHTDAPAPLAVTVSEAARLLSISRRTLYELIHDGRLRSIKINRRRLIPRSELDRLLSEGGNP